MQSSFKHGALILAALAAPAMATADGAKWYEKVSLGGYAEAFYQQQFIEGSGTAAPQTPQNRAFDKLQSQFQGASGELLLSAADEASKTAYMLDLIFGSKASAITSDTSTVVAVAQAYVSGNYGPAKLTLGKFGTFIGTEVWNTTANSNFSRGVVYQAEPFHHTGLKADLSLPADFTLSAVIDNGDSVTVTASSDKGYGGILAFAGIKGASLTGSFYKSPVVSGSEIKAKTYGNFLASYSVMESLGLAGEYLYVCDPSSGTVATPFQVSHGVALYANYTTPLPGLLINGRFEQLTKVDAVQVYDTYTLTLKYLDGPLTHILEYRGDAANTHMFSGMKAADPAVQTQTTVTYAAVYGF